MKNQSEMTVMTLDAGGTNFVFSAITNAIEVVKPVIFPSNADHREKCLKTIINGFEEIKKQLGNVDAISFAFPGPANYKLGIIENLPNFKAFTGGVALGPMLENHFGIPAFINNDGDLFAFGEAKYGILPDVNKKLKNTGSDKYFKNLTGFTIGTGFGCGIVINGHILQGDNYCGAEIHNTLNCINPLWNAEESVSTRAIIRVYNDLADDRENHTSYMPRDIADIALGKQDGNKKAALESFRMFGKNLGSSIANALSLIDGLVVIGGGITNAWNLFEASMFDEINKNYLTEDKTSIDRLSFQVFNLENENIHSPFYKGNRIEITIPGNSQTIKYDNMYRTGIALSKLGASKAIALGAYAFASQKLRE